MIIDDTCINAVLYRRNVSENLIFSLTEGYFVSPSLIFCFPYFIHHFQNFQNILILNDVILEIWKYRFVCTLPLPLSLSLSLIISHVDETLTFIMNCERLVREYCKLVILTLLLFTLICGKGSKVISILLWHKNHIEFLMWMVADVVHIKCIISCLVQC